MAKPKKGVVPPHLRAYLFRKGHAGAKKKGSVSRKKAKQAIAAIRGARKALDQKTGRVIVNTRRSPSPKAKRQYNPTGFKLVVRRGKGPAMHFDGVKFSNNGKPKLFSSAAAAKEMALLLREQFPILKPYSFYAIDPGRKLGK